MCEALQELFADEAEGIDGIWRTEETGISGVYQVKKSV